MHDRATASPLPSAAAPVDFPPVSLDEDPVQKTTSGDIALRNLSAKIESLTARRAQFKDETATSVQLGDLLLSRAPFIGSYDDLAAANHLAEELLTEAPDSPLVNAYAARASASP